MGVIKVLEREKWKNCLTFYANRAGLRTYISFSDFCSNNLFLLQPTIVVSYNYDVVIYVLSPYT